MDFNKKTLLISAVLSLVTLSMIFFVIVPLFRSVESESKEISKIKEELFVLQDKTENLENIQNVYDTWNEDLEKIEDLFVDPQVPINLISFWEKTAFELEVSINISPTAIRSDEEEDLWPSIGFQLSLTGSFANFSKFLAEVESSPYLLEIQNLTIRELSEADLLSERLQQFSIGDVSSTLTIKVYAK